ncbi:MAG: glycosyltransferase family A protein [bacterium]
MIKNNEEQSKVSVIIPTYNRYDTISGAIQSVLNQTYQNFEIVIIDDSENDKTAKLINTFNEKRIRYIRNKARKNIPSARNQGVRESGSDSKYVAFLDDDDEYFPLFLEKLIKSLEEKRELTGATCFKELRIQENKKIGVDRCSKEPWRIYIGNGYILRKELFEKENYWFDERLTHFEEWDFGIRVLENHKIECISEILFMYRCSSLEERAERDSLHTFMPPEEIEQFYKNHYLLYSQWGRGALGYLCFYTGRFLLRIPEIKKGRKYLLKAFLTYPHPKYFLAYLLSLIAPGSYQKSLKILIYKIFNPGFFKNRSL